MVTDLLNAIALTGAGGFLLFGLWCLIATLTDRDDTDDR